MGLKSVRCVRYSAAGALAARARRMMEENGGWGKGGGSFFSLLGHGLKGRGAAWATRARAAKGWETTTRRCSHRISHCAELRGF